MQMAHRILNMFNPTVVPLSSGTNIDRPMNALTMTRPACWLISHFKIAFEHIGPHTYKIDLVRPDYPPDLQRAELPVTRTLDLAPDHNIDPPSADLLKIHSAIAKILYLSDASRFIDRFFGAMGEMEARLFKPDVTSRIDEYVASNLAGCFEEMSTEEESRI
ncbi:hypothetical protein P168DRAFT_187671 [Aspergillus campestris IBT 28561]|uniref:HNH nuclease domain-containing protein n=1 Tax=Aspergillus campestris (strain IBT 28561) TaxID=1392248 RepID=A0A2I1CYC6_ASPC2|nr:uncharacterized protein P168DRAFT_187671 [Aspergillus campestris IBT 28561]PKY02623.1 hypothetical protein P168DRAFT_187671 [Aspergillus campestris IBT 28561]